MVSVLDLPSELVVEIFRYLSPDETNHVINQIKHPYTNRIDFHPINHINYPHPNHPSTKLLSLLYFRLYNGKLTIINDDPKDNQQTDILLTIHSFEEIFLVNNYENMLFQGIRPRSVEIKFTRQINDYSKFINNMYEFNGILEKNSNELIIDYFEKIQQVNFYADGNLMMMENPATLSTIMIKILINLTETSLALKLARISIKSFDIGDFYVSRWSQLFRNFENLEYLDLSDNLIRSDYDDSDDIMGMSFKFPPKLKNLILDGNSISRMTANFVKNVPASIEVILLNRNLISEIGVNEPLDLASYLPNLRLLRLNHNRIGFINPSSFVGILSKDLVVEARACNLTPGNLRALKSVAEVEKFSIII
jgi:hypothetical protein